MILRDDRDSPYTLSGQMTGLRTQVLWRKGCSGGACHCKCTESRFGCGGLECLLPEEEDGAELSFALLSHFYEGSC
jgi:hypothetical protein